MEGRRLARLPSCAIYIAISSSFAAFHGSSNRKKRTGYKIVRVPFDHSTGKPRGEYDDFVTGFVTADGNVWGRPVGITVAKDGSLIFSEDGNGTICARALEGSWFSKEVIEPKEDCCPLCCA